MKRFLIGLVAIVAVLANPAAFAQVKISALPDATALAGTEQTPVVQSGVTAKMTPAQINTYIRSLAGTWTGNQSVTGTLSSTGLLTAGASAAVTGTVGATGQMQSTFVSTATVPNFQAFSTDPQIELRDSNSAANTQRWNFNTGATTLNLRACNDIGTSCTSVFQAGRLNEVVNALTFGDTTGNPVISFPGSGQWLIGGSSGTASQVLTSNGPGVAPTWQTAGAGVTLANGTWTPVCTLGAGMSNCTASAGNYLRVGTTVQFTFAYNGTGPNAVQNASMTMPVASNNTGNFVFGTCASTGSSGSMGRVTSGGANILQVTMNASQTVQIPWTCTGMYQVN